MILLDDGIQEFRLPKFGEAPECSLWFQSFRCNGVGCALIHCDGTRIERMQLLQRLPEGPSSSSRIPLGRKQEVNCQPGRSDSTIEGVVTLTRI